MTAPVSMLSKSQWIKIGLQNHGKPLRDAPYALAHLITNLRSSGKYWPPNLVPISGMGPSSAHYRISL